MTTKKPTARRRAKQLTQAQRFMLAMMIAPEPFIAMIELVEKESRRIVRQLANDTKP